MKDNQPTTLRELQRENEKRYQSDLKDLQYKCPHTQRRITCVRGQTVPYMMDYCFTCGKVFEQLSMEEFWQRYLDTLTKQVARLTWLLDKAMNQKFREQHEGVPVMAHLADVSLFQFDPTPWNSERPHGYTNTEKAEHLVNWYKSLSPWLQKWYRLVIL